MKISPRNSHSLTAKRALKSAKEHTESLVPGVYPQVQEDLLAFPKPVLRLMDEYGIRVAVLGGEDTFIDSPALRLLTEDEYTTERKQAREITLEALKSTEVSNLEDFAKSTTRLLRKAGLEFHFGMSKQARSPEFIAQQQGISEADFPKWKAAFLELNDGFPPGFCILPHVYHEGQAIPENRLRGAKELKAPYIKDSLGLNRQEERLVLLHDAFLDEPAEVVGNYRLAIHEVGHALDYILDRLTGVPGFGENHRKAIDTLYARDLARAEKEGKETVFTSDRADDDVREYFAEAVEAYLTQPKNDGGDFFRAENSAPGLKARNPELYNYVDKVMHTNFPSGIAPTPPSIAVLPPQFWDPNTEVVWF